MINLLEKKIKELEQAQDYECWYLVKQDTTFENLCYQVQFLKQWNESNKEKNLETYMKDEVSKLNIHENLKVSTTHRALKVATYFGLIEGVSYSTSKITDTFLEIQERCNGQFKNFNLYSDIIQRQIEKMFISSEIDEQANDLRKEFRLFPVLLLYKVLLEIGKVTGSFSITTDEYKYLVATTKNYKDFLDTLLLIKLSRENNWDGYDISSLRSKFDNRMLQALKQLPTLEITSSSISITKDKETEVAEKVYYFENELLDYEIDDYISFLGSTKSLFNVKKSEKKNINNDMETLFKEYLQLQQYQPNDVIKFVGRLKSGKRLAELVGIDPDVSAYDYKKLEDYIEFYEQAIGASNFDEINKSTSGELKSALDAYKRCLEYKESLPYNRIYFGAPGTGKSYGVSKLIKQLYPDFDFEDSDGSKFVFRTTFHPEYTYSDFVGQVMPVVKSNGDISYDFTPGVFTRALQQALDLPTKKVFLVLEELSRANVAAVFGDLFQLLDRNEEGNSEYGITNHLIAKEVYHAGDVVDSTGTINAEEVKLVNKKIKLPSNLIILATVNTNDQNVFAMDTAFKRRFEWEYVSIDPVKDKNGELLNNEIVKIPSANGLESMTWCKFYPLLNDYITSDMELSEDKQIGQFFIKFVKDNDKKNQVEVLNKLLQYLWEDVNNMAFKSKLFTTEIKSFGKLYSSWKDALENDAKVNIFDKSFYDKLGVKGENKVEEVEVPEVDNNSFEEEEDNEERD